MFTVDSIFYASTRKLRMTAWRISQLTNRIIVINELISDSLGVFRVTALLKFRREGNRSAVRVDLSLARRSLQSADTRHYSLSPSFLTFPPIFSRSSLAKGMLYNRELVIGKTLTFYQSLRVIGCVELQEHLHSKSVRKNGLEHRQVRDENDKTF